MEGGGTHSRRRAPPVLHRGVRRRRVRAAMDRRDHQMIKPDESRVLALLAYRISPALLAFEAGQHNVDAREALRRIANGKERPIEEREQAAMALAELEGK